MLMPMCVAMIFVVNTIDIASTTYCTSGSLPCCSNVTQTCAVGFVNNYVCCNGLTCLSDAFTIANPVFAIAAAALGLPLNTCIDCYQNSQCSLALPLCDNFVCSPCAQDSDCSPYANNKRCANTPTGNECVQCLSNNDCTSNLAAPTCTQSTSKCGCSKNANNAACPSTAPFCSTNGCNECRGNGDCTSKYVLGQLPYCVSGTCKQCTSSNQCGISSPNFVWPPCSLPTCKWTCSTANSCTRTRI